MNRWGIVFRIEHRETGIGPFRHFQTSREAEEYLGIHFYQTPHPVQTWSWRNCHSEKKLGELCLNKTDNEMNEYFFSFRSLSTLYRRAKYCLNTLSEKGFVIRVYKTRGTALRGAEQVMFKKKDAVLVREIELS
jgi:hypothetical protein